MRRSHTRKFSLLLLVVTALAAAQASSFPEIPFCPLGGPPGWANRLFDIRDRDYPPPRYYGVPYYQQNPAYTPVTPDGYQYYGYPARPYQGY